MTDSVFIGRSTELARLETFLDRALEGRAQVVFVTGEAGSGKTAFARTFAERMQDQHDDLIVAVGTCSAQGGLGDPYLPFRQVLGILTGTVADRTLSDAGKRRNTERLKAIGARSVQVLVEVGPELVGAFVPGASLVGALGKAVAHKAGWMADLDQLAGPKSASSPALDQQRLMEQYANVLNALAQDNPLLLILDDLHWADDASLSLLFHLSRRLEASRVLIVGTYRQDEVALPRRGERHPLEKIVSEITRYAGAVTLDLSAAAAREAATFVEQLIDSEPNALDAQFRATLLAHTSGQPLFTVELLRALQERGSLVKDANGRWVMARTLDWGTLPARVEGVIQERIGRLDETQHDLLRTASVEGLDFIAEVLAQVQQTPLRSLLKELSQNLEKRHRLVHAEGEISVGREQLARYQFAHALFQQYVYDELSRGERRILHGEVARVLEQMYQGQTDEIAAQLAWHYDEAGDAEKAVEYLLIAGERASNQGAPHEAKRCFDRALELSPSDASELRWRALSGRLLIAALTGETVAARADMAALLELADKFGDDRHRAEAYWLASGFYEENPSMALEAADISYVAAQKDGNLSLQARALGAKIEVLRQLGQTDAAQELIEHALTCALASGDQDALGNTLFLIAKHYAEVGDLSLAVQFLARSIEQARETGNRWGEAASLGNLGYVYMLLGLYNLARATLEDTLQQNERMGMRVRYAFNLQNLGLTYSRLGDRHTARRLEEQSLAEVIMLDNHFGEAVCRLYLGHISEQTHNCTNAAAYFAKARVGFEKIGAVGFMMDAVAGTARCALAQNKPDEAGQYAMQVWNHLRGHGARGVEMPVLAYLTCARVFDAQGDAENSRAAMEAGYRELMTRADKISDPEWRQSFLGNVAEHRALIEMWERGK